MVFQCFFFFFFLIFEISMNNGYGSSMNGNAVWWQFSRGIHKCCFHQSWPYGVCGRRGIVAGSPWYLWSRANISSRSPQNVSHPSVSLFQDGAGNESRISPIQRHNSLTLDSAGWWTPPPSPLPTLKQNSFCLFFGKFRGNAKLHRCRTFNAAVSYLYVMIDVSESVLLEEGRERTRILSY